MNLRRMLAAAVVTATGIAVQTVAAADEAAPAPPSASWNAWAKRFSLSVPDDRTVAFRGVVSFDDAGIGSGQMLYPAPNLGGFIAAIVTHGVIAESAKSAQKTKLQETADKVLGPYEPVLSKFTYGDLMRRVLSRQALPATATPTPKGDKPPLITVEKEPMFSMTQDERSIIVDVVVSIRPDGDPAAAAIDSAVRIVSAPLEPKAASSLWAANDGEKLKEESAALLLESVSLAAARVETSADNEHRPYRTIRYWEGGVEKIERAQIINEDCGRITVLTLRGTVMSVPAVQRAAGAEVARSGCARPPAGQTTTPT